MFHGSTGSSAKDVMINPKSSDLTNYFGPLFYTFEGFKTGIYRALSFALDRASISSTPTDPIISWYIVPNNTIESKLNADVDRIGWEQFMLEKEPDCIRLL